MSVLRVKVYLSTIITLYILPLIPIWYFDYLPILDYPRHLAGIKVLRGYDSRFLQEYFSIHFFKGLSPIPNIAFEIFASKICFFCDVNTAGKLFISAYVVLFILSVYLLSRELKLDYVDALLISLPLVYSSYLYMGFLNFVFSIPIFLLSIWSYTSAKREEKYFLLLGILSTILYVSHLFAFASFLLFLLIDMLVSSFKPGRRFILLAALSMSLPILFFANYIFLTAGSPVAYPSEGIQDKVIMLASPFIYFSLGLGITMFFCYIYALFVIFYGSSSINKVHLSAAVIYLILYFVLPFSSIEGSYVDMRAIAFSMIMVPFSVKLEGNRYKWGVFTIIVLLTLINNYAAWNSFSRFDKEISPGIECLKEAEDGSSLLPVSGKTFGLRYLPEGPELHAWGYAFLKKDFITPDFSATVHHILRYREKPYIPPKEWYMLKDKEEVWNEVKRNYDYVAIFGKDQSIKSRIARIGEKVCEEGTVTLYKVEK